MSPLRINLLSAFCLTLFVFGTATLGADEENSTTRQLTVQIYYETRCPDSMHFIRSQLHYAMVTKDWMRYADLQFIPYGKAWQVTDPTTNITTLQCQHGAEECEENALHACVVEHNNKQEQLNLINCLMRGYSMTVDECGMHFNIDVSAVKQCKATRSIVDILGKYGVQTNAIDMTFVPAVSIDGVFDPWKQRRLLHNFARVFCEHYQEKYNVTLERC